MSIDERNRKLYSDAPVVKHYARASELQPAERAIFTRIAHELAGATLLDIGVGGGRTTVHLAPLVKRYVGLDYSPAMLTAVRSRFPDPAYEFLLGDARSLPFSDDEFDIVLFSHNGIDYVDHDDRLVILREVHRVLWPGGTFVFSTHNLGRDDLRFEGAPDEGLFSRAIRAPGRARLRAHNPEHERLRDRPYAILNDGAFAFRAATYHIHVSAQIDQLASAGFRTVTVLGGRDGRDVDTTAACDRVRDPWLYFVCTAA